MLLNVCSLSVEFLVREALGSFIVWKRGTATDMKHFSQFTSPSGFSWKVNYPYEYICHNMLSMWLITMHILLVLFLTAYSTHEKHTCLYAKQTIEKKVSTFVT